MIFDKIFFRLFARVMSLSSKSSCFGVGFLEPGLFGVKFEGIFVVLKSLLKIPDFVETGSPCEKCIDMLRIELNDY